MSFSAVRKVLKNKSTVSMGRQAPTAFLMDYRNVTVFTAFGNQLV